MSEWGSEGWSVWLSYRPSDFLMFAPRIYWRMFETLNQAVWPAQLPVMSVALGWLLWFMRRGAAAAPRASALALALCWGFVGWALMWQRYAPINTAAAVFTAAFAVQALGLLGLAACGGLRVAVHAARRRTGLVMLIGALIAYPLLAGLAGRPWAQAEVFAIAPDPTAIGTLGWLLLWDGGTRAARARQRALGVVPWLWCMFSAATLGTMGSMQALLPLGAGVAAVAALRH